MCGLSGSYSTVSTGSLGGEPLDREPFIRFPAASWYSKLHKPWLVEIEVTTARAGLPHLSSRSSFGCVKYQSRRGRSQRLCWAKASTLFAK
jgi:hypothetical protein